MITFNAWFFREFFIYPFTGFIIIIAFCSLLHSFLSYSVALFFIMVETSSHSTFVVIPYSFYVP
jgi:hypothetical protein